jgi:hypothetical protein
MDWLGIGQLARIYRRARRHARIAHRKDGIGGLMVRFACAQCEVDQMEGARLRRRPLQEIVVRRDLAVRYAD